VRAESVSPPLPKNHARMQMPCLPGRAATEHRFRVTLIDFNCLRDDARRSDRANRISSRLERQGEWGGRISDGPATPSSATRFLFEFATEGSTVTNAAASHANVIPLHPLEDAEALAWLRDQPDGRIETRLIDLAHQFGWPRTRLRRRLAIWIEAGQVTRQPGRKGKAIIAAALARADDDRMPAAQQRQAAARMIDRAFSADAPPIPKSRRSVVAVGAAAVLLATARGLAAVGLTMNARFAASFGQTAEAAVLLAAIGLAIDLLAVVLPTVAAQLWHHRSRSAAVTAWSIWLVALTMTLLAATGFASTNIGDAVAGRAKIAGESSALAQRLERLRLERAGIAETRAVAAIDVELQRAQPSAQSVWKATAGCRDVTLPASGRACAAVLQLREQLATAQRRDAIDAELRDAEATFAALPPVALADPQAANAAEIVAWLSAGRINPEPRDISRLRTVGLTITPSLAGLIAMLAFSLAGGRRV
jgi:hypothetical protein